MHLINRHVSFWGYTMVKGMLERLMFKKLVEREQYLLGFSKIVCFFITLCLDQLTLMSKSKICGTS